MNKKWVSFILATLLTASVAACARPSEDDSVTSNPAQSVETNNSASELQTCPPETTSVSEVILGEPWPTLNELYRKNGSMVLVEFTEIKDGIYADDYGVDAELGKILVEAKIVKNYYSNNNFAEGSIVYLPIWIPVLKEQKEEISSETAAKKTSNNVDSEIASDEVYSANEAGDGEDYPVASEGIYPDETVYMDRETLVSYLQQYSRAVVYLHTTHINEYYKDAKKEEKISLTNVSASVWIEKELFPVNADGVVEYTQLIDFLEKNAECGGGILGGLYYQADSFIYENITLEQFEKNIQDLHKE